MSAAPVAAAAPAPVPAAAWRTLRIASIAAFAVYMDTTILFVAFGSIRQTFATVSVAQLSWVLNAYTIVFAALLVPAGRLADRLGRRRVYLGGVVLFTAGSALCGVAPGPALLVAARVLQAAGAALVAPASLALTLAAFPRARRATAVAVWGAVGALAAALGPSLGAAIVAIGGWRWAFYINLPVGVVAYLLGRQLEESAEGDRGPLPDALGVLLLLAGVALLALGIVQGESWGWLDGRTWGAGIGGVLVLGAFVLRTLHARAPALDLTLFADPNYRAANIATAAYGAVFTAMFFGNIQYLTQVWHYPIWLAGLAITPGPLVVTQVAVRAGRIAEQRGHRAVLVPGALIYALAGLWLYARAGVDHNYLTAWLPGALIGGAGVGMVLPMLNSAAVHALLPAQYGVGGAVNQAVRQLGGVIGVALVVVIWGQGALAGAPNRVFLLQVAGGVLTALLCLSVRTRPVGAKA